MLQPLVKGVWSLLLTSHHLLLKLFSPWKNQANTKQWAIFFLSLFFLLFRCSTKRPLFNLSRSLDYVKLLRCKVYHHIKCHKTYSIRWAVSSKELLLQYLKSYETPKREYWRSHFNLYHLCVCKLFIPNVLPLPIKYIEGSPSLEN